MCTDPTLESGHASSRGCGSGEKRLNKALIQPLGLDSHSPLLSAPAQAGGRQRKGGEDRKSNQEIPPKTTICLCVNELERQGCTAIFIKE